MLEDWSRRPPAVELTTPVLVLVGIGVVALCALSFWVGRWSAGGPERIAAQQTPREEAAAPQLTFLEEVEARERAAAGTSGEPGEAAAPAEGEPAAVPAAAGPAAGAGEGGAKPPAEGTPPSGRAAPASPPAPAGKPAPPVPKPAAPQAQPARAASPAPAAAPEAPVPEGGGSSLAPDAAGYLIQVYATEERERAEALRTGLQRKGYPASVESTEVRGRTYYRVRVGPYEQKSRADRTARRLQIEEKLTTWILRP